ncbi:uncharacterized protein LOC129253285 [Anastrepha obliqua]|uniref:uncharacterized protein LOC129253285 n=1 Tax=Anastrepha obliqua TaxID=95512 RepID=UPI00240A5A1B|nr:uncharacterized protein LOC129253285 [Anastrepha obliqua]
MQLFRNITALLSLIELSPIFQQFNQAVTDICIATATEQKIRTFIYTSIGSTNCGTHSHTHLNVPLILHTLHTQNPTTAVINIDKRTPIERYSEQFNRKVLSIVQLSQNKPRDEQLLQSLWKRIYLNRQSALILLFDDRATEAYVAMILKFCAEQRAPNVIALQPHMALQERSYWTLQIFPIQKTVKRTFQPFYRDLFPKHLKNMHGHPLRVMNNYWYPQFYNYTPKQGPKRLSGYSGRALTEYAHHHNATIQSAFDPRTNSSPIYEVREALEANVADIGILLPIELGEQKLGSTSVVRRTNWCLMVPVEAPIPAYTFYYSIMGKWVVSLFCVSVVLISLIWARVSHRQPQQQQPIIENFVNVSVLQGLLGMPFWTRKSLSTIHKIICINISLAGVILGTAYSTYLQSLNVNAPKEPPMKTIDDVLKRGLKVAVGNRAAHWIKHFTDFDKYLPNFTYFSNSTELLVLRDKLDTSYAFPVSDTWSIYNEQQKYFSQPLFRLSDICLGRDIQLILPLQKDSIYSESLDIFFLNLHQTGFIIYWLRHSFIELLEMDVISLEDRNKQPLFVPLKLEDLRLVFMGMGVLLSLSILCFVLELFWRKIKNLLNAIKKGMRNIMKIAK